MLKTRLLKFVAQPIGMLVSAAVTLCVISLVYSGVEWWHGDPTAWKHAAASTAILMGLGGNMLDASRRKTRIVLLTTSCLMVVVFYAGIVMNANHRNADAHPSASNTVERH